MQQDNRQFPAHVHMVNHPLVKDKISRLRATKTDSKTFRDLVSEITQLVCFEATRDLPLTTAEIDTPVTRCVGHVLATQPAIVPILRAGLGMQEGMLSMLPTAQVFHIGLYRDEMTFSPIEYYNKLPSKCHAKYIYLLDPMLATAGSACAAIDILKNWTETSPELAPKITFICLLASPGGIKTLTSRHPDVEIFTANIDEGLNDHGFITPGAGDVGDRLFNTVRKA
eukprot:ANDGO_06808.mRNA.1 Uracil phosphoribosyltransferase